MFDIIYDEMEGIGTMDNVAEAVADSIKAHINNSIPGTALGYRLANKSVFLLLVLAAIKGEIDRDQVIFKWQDVPNCSVFNSFHIGEDGNWTDNRLPKAEVADKLLSIVDLIKYEREKLAK